MKFSRILKIVTIFLAVVLFAGYIFSVYPTPTTEQAEQELAEYMFREMKEWLWPESAFERFDIPNTPQIIVWYPLEYTAQGSEWGDEPIRVWWYENGEWEEIQENKKDIVDNYLENYAGTDSKIWGYYYFGIKKMEIPYMRYRAVLSYGNSQARLSGRGGEIELVRGPFGWWFTIGSKGLWVN